MGHYFSPIISFSLLQLLASPHHLPRSCNHSTKNSVPSFSCLPSLCALPSSDGSMTSHTPLKTIIVPRPVKFPLRMYHLVPRGLQWHAASSQQSWDLNPYWPAWKTRLLITLLHCVVGDLSHKQAHNHSWAQQHMAITNISILLSPCLCWQKPQHPTGISSRDFSLKR